MATPTTAIFGRHGKVVVGVTPHPTGPALLFTAAVRGHFGGYVGGVAAPSALGLLVAGRGHHPRTSVVVGGSGGGGAGGGLSGA